MAYYLEDDVLREVKSVSAALVVFKLWCDTNPDAPIIEVGTAIREYPVRWRDFMRAVYRDDASVAECLVAASQRYIEYQEELDK